MTDTILSLPPVIAMPQPPPFPVDATLHFLPGGHYLFCHYKDLAVSKFVTAADVAAAFTGADQDTGYIPPGVVRIGRCAKGPFFAYSTPAQRVLVTIQSGNNSIESLVPVPRLVLLGLGSSYFLWALKSTTFTPTAPAYHAPFPNVYPTGLICWGANTPPEADPRAARKVWDLFFSSPFNEHLIDDKSAAHPRDVRIQLSAIAGGRKYPLDDLRPIDRIIQVAIDAVLGGR